MAVAGMKSPAAAAEALVVGKKRTAAPRARSILVVLAVVLLLLDSSPARLVQGFVIPTYSRISSRRKILFPRGGQSRLCATEKKPGEDEDYEFGYYDDGIGNIASYADNNNNKKIDDDDEEFYASLRELQRSNDTDEDVPPQVAEPEPKPGADLPSVPRVSPMITLRPDGAIKGRLFDEGINNAPPPSSPRATNPSNSNIVPNPNPDNTPGFGRSPYYQNNISNNNNNDFLSRDENDFLNTAPRARMMQREFNLVEASSSREAFLLQASIAIVFLLFALYVGLSGGIQSGDTMVRDFGGEDLLPFQDVIPLSRDSNDSIWI